MRLFIVLLMVSALYGMAHGSTEVIHHFSMLSTAYHDAIAQATR